MGFPGSESEFKKIAGITEFDGRDIMKPQEFFPTTKPGEVASTGQLGNRGGHNVTDNGFILDIPAGQQGYIEPRKDKPSNPAGTKVGGAVKKPGGQ
jgi:hypothetical protein